MKPDKKITLQKSTGNDPVQVLQYVLSSYNLMGFARKLTRCSDKAQDLFQDTVERILKYAPKLEHRGESYTKNWATSIMYGIFVNNYRKSKIKRRKENQLSLESTEDYIQDFLVGDEEIPESELSSIIIDALSLLTERQRKVTFLIAKDYQYKEIAEELDMPVGTVMSTLGRGRKALRENIQLLEYVEKEYGIKAA
jgi:RNA polymerase sigma-70 factor (ECF subfamily)